MESIIGKVRQIIFHNVENGFLVAVFRVLKTDSKEAYSIVISGKMPKIVDNINIELTGETRYNEKYHKSEFNFVSYKEIIPEETDSIIEFLTSPLIKGCGKKTAEKLVGKYKEKTLEKIKSLENILKVEGISEKTAIKINNAILKYDLAATTIVELQNIGFTIEESSKIYNKFDTGSLDIIKDNLYKLKDLVNFKKLDSIYLSTNNYDDYNRVYACTIEVMKNLSFNEGHTYYTIDMIKTSLVNYYNLYLSKEDNVTIFDEMVLNNEIVIEEEKIYLKGYYLMEEAISNKLNNILNSKKSSKLTILNEDIEALEKAKNISYDKYQKDAIMYSLNENISIISGGPGTGKTTILNSIVNLYLKKSKLSRSEASAHIALLAPTGRASKKMMSSTGFKAYTIHRFLKWNKDNDTFEFNENNKLCHDFIVVDECSMVDLKLFDSLLKALKNNIKLILVGDQFQLPSVSAGSVFNDLINSNIFNYINLTKIYRQSDNSYIPELAYSIKTMNLNEEFLNKKDDYNFIECPNESIKNLVSEVCMRALKKNINEFDMQVLVPMYKGSNGIDLLNQTLRNIYNPSNFTKKEILHNNILYRENDKVLQLVNDTEKNIYNGDIGVIKEIKKDGNNVTLSIKFDDVYAEISRKDLINLTHAYAISIHKSQGSEFSHVIMPISYDYRNMMYNKLIYTGVSRAKETLTLIGDKDVFINGVSNNSSHYRNSSLKDKILSINNSK